MQDTESLLRVLTFLGSILTVSVSIFLALYVHYVFAPVFEIGLFPRWEGTQKEYLVVGFRVKNCSRVRVEKPEIMAELVFCSSEFQYIGPTRSSINEDSILSVESIDSIYSSEGRFFPGETIYRESIIHRNTQASAVFVHLRLQIQLRWWQRILLWKSSNWSQGASSIIVAGCHSPG